MEIQPAFDTTGYKTRTIKVNGVSYTALANIYRHSAEGWQVRFERVGEKTTRKYFADAIYGCPQRSLDAAHRWRVEKQVRKPFEGIDLARSPVPNLTVRRVGSPEGSKRLHRYELLVMPSRSSWQRPWMKLYPGNAGTITQARIIECAAILHGRWQEFRKRKIELGTEAALEEDYTQVPPAPPGTHHTRLWLKDVLGWTGRSKGVSFSPTPKGEPGEAVDPKVAAAARKSTMRSNGARPATARP